MKSNIIDICHSTIYESPLSPGHLAWVSLWKVSRSSLRVSFQVIEGDRNQSPSYDFMKLRFRKKYLIKQKICSSHDFGKTWISDAEYNMRLPNLLFYVTPHLCCDGFFYAVSASHNVVGFPKNKLIVYRSSDGGIKWDHHCLISPPGDGAYFPTQIFERDGVLRIAVYTRKGECLILFSVDNGRNWKEEFVLAKACSQISFWEPAVAFLDTNHLICIMRTHYKNSEKKQVGINYHQVFVEKQKGRWVCSKPVDIGIGFCGKPSLINTSSKTLILNVPNGTFAFSQNNGLTWEINRTIMKGLPHSADLSCVEISKDCFICTYFFGSDWPFPPPVNESIGVTSFKMLKN